MCQVILNNEQVDCLTADMHACPLIHESMHAHVCMHSHADTHRNRTYTVVCTYKCNISEHVYLNVCHAGFVTVDFCFCWIAQILFRLILNVT